MNLDNKNEEGDKGHVRVGDIVKFIHFFGLR